MNILITALALAAQQPAQSSIPLPPGPAPDDFGIHLSVDGDRALVGMLFGTDSAIWSYRRNGLSWVPEAPFPAAAFAGTVAGDFAFDCLELSGDVALVGATATELSFDGTSWVITDQLPDVTLWDADLAGGLGIGTGPLPSGHSGVVIAERGPSGWSVAETFTATEINVFVWTDMAIEGDVAVVGDANWWHCSHLAWDGTFGIIERDPGSGIWSVAQQVSLTDCTESLLAASLEVSNGSIFATREVPNQIEVYQRGPGGLWGKTNAIEPPAGHRLLLPSPGGSFEGEVGSEARPVIRGDVAFVPFAEVIPTSPFIGTQRVGRFERQPLTHHWQLTDTYDTPGTALCWLGGTNENRYGTIAPIRIEGGAEAPLGAMVPVRGPLGCLVGVNVYEPVVSSPTCSGTPTSSGVPARLDLVGSFRRADGLTTFAASSLPAGAFALPLFSQTPGFTANPGGSAGNLCIGAPITRLLPFIGAADGAGEFHFAVDIDGGLSGATVPPGTPTYFQLWFRDVTTAGQATSNFTNGAVMRSW